MAKYAYTDKERKQRIYATDAIQEDRDKIFYCPNPNCTAELHICAVDGSKNAYFRATKSKFPHISNCPFGSNVVNFNRDQFDESNFIFESALDNLFTAIKENSKKCCQSNGHKVGEVKKHPPRTLMQIYSLCKSYDVKDKYANKEISEMILDDRTAYRYPRGCFGHKIIEANVNGKIYDNKSKQIYLVAPIDSKKYSFILQFEDEILYKSIRNEIYNNSNKLIIVAGKWERSNTYNWFQTTIQGRKQVAIVKK